jgi:hypothetical protein
VVLERSSGIGSGRRELAPRARKGVGEGTRLRNDSPDPAQLPRQIAKVGESGARLADPFCQSASYAPTVTVTVVVTLAPALSVALMVSVVVPAARPWIVSRLWLIVADATVGVELLWIV